MSLKKDLLSERSPRTEDEDFISDTKAALLTQTSVAASLFLYVISALVIIFLIWAYFAPIDQNVTGIGKVIPASQVKIIQSLDGGIITQIDVREGQMVKKNQVLAQLDTTRYKADYEQTNAQYSALTGMVSRLQAEVYGEKEIKFPEGFATTYPDIVKRETQLFETRNEALTNDLTLLKDNYESSEKQAKLMKEGVDKGYVAKIDYLRIQLTANDARQKWQTRKNQFYESAWTELNQRNAQLEAAKQQLTSLKDKITHATIISPVNGIIKKINITTIGGVIQPGVDVMEIVPLEDTLLVEAKVSPADIAFIHLKQPVSVKITAYDYSIYGDLKGEVENISADTIEDKQTTYSANKFYYLIDVRTKQSYILHHGEKLPIMPGMAATVSILTGKKTVMQYLLKPLIKAKMEGLHEK